MKPRMLRLFPICIVLLAGCLHGAPELNLRLQYPQQSNDVVLTGHTRNSIEFRPQGRDTGGRAYIDFDDLIDHRAVLNFPFPEEFYNAIEELEQGQFLKALPAIEKHAAPFVEYATLVHLPGNLTPTLLSYIDALTLAARWDHTVEVVESIPLEKAPSVALRTLARTLLTIENGNEADAVKDIQEHILNTTGFTDAHLAELMTLADKWRDRGNYLRAFELYRKVQAIEGVNQTQARLWVAYCSFYLGHDLVPEVFLENLPEMEQETAGFSLKELIKARLALRSGDYAAAMRSASEAKVYANAIDPWYPELLYTVALAYKEIGMLEAAKIVYQELTILFPETPWAREGLGDEESITPEASTS